MEFYNISTQPLCCKCFVPMAAGVYDTENPGQIDWHCQNGTCIQFGMAYRQKLATVALTPVTH